MIFWKTKLWQDFICGGRLSQNMGPCTSMERAPMHVLDLGTCSWLLWRVLTVRTSLTNGIWNWCSEVGFLKILKTVKPMSYLYLWQTFSQLSSRIKDEAGSRLAQPPSATLAAKFWSCYIFLTFVLFAMPHIFKP